MSRTGVKMVALAALITGCGGAAPEGAKSPTTAEEQQGEEVGAPNVPWSEKTFAQRQDYMGLEVLPAMKEAFQAHDAEGFHKFKCQTCHGDDMRKVKFKMPNDLYALPKDNPYQAALDYDPEMTKFMAEVVLPKMAKLLDMKPLDPAVGEGDGFGCLGCHATE